MARSHAIATNIITGFLGVGKTTAIRRLLIHKPADEIWAVLVNEFGEIGIDGGLLKAGSKRVEDIHIRELPGGCLCCTAGVPFQVALNQLIRQSRPQRLLIEPTGLGHPREVISMLSSADYADSIDLQATITLVDARKIAEPRYREHQIFRQQLQVADRIIANKRDLYQAQDERQLREFLCELKLQHLPVNLVEQGRLNYAWLGETRKEITTSNTPTEANASVLDLALPLPECGYRRVDNRRAEFHSSGWVFASSFRFDFDRLFELMHGIEAERIKAIVHTDRGWTVFNKADGVVSHTRAALSPDSRIEVIGLYPARWGNLQSELMNAVLD